MSDLRFIAGCVEVVASILVRKTYHGAVQLPHTNDGSSSEQFSERENGIRWLLTVCGVLLIR